MAATEQLDAKTPAPVIGVKKEKEKVKPCPEMKRRMAAVLKADGNQTCVDCLASRPLWVSFLTSPIEENKRMGVICCSNCIQHHHYELGTKRTMIKYLKLPHEWHLADIEILELTGNKFANIIYEAKKKSEKDFDKALAIGKDDDDATEEDLRRKFVEQKYKKLKFWDESTYHQQMLKVALKTKDKDAAVEQASPSHVESVGSSSPVKRRSKSASMEDRSTKSQIKDDLARHRRHRSGDSHRKKSKDRRNSQSVLMDIVAKKEERTNSREKHRRGRSGSSHKKSYRNRSGDKKPRSNRYEKDEKKSSEAPDSIITYKRNSTVSLVSTLSLGSTLSSIAAGSLSDGIKGTGNQHIKYGGLDRAIEKATKGALKESQHSLGHHFSQATMLQQSDHAVVTCGRPVTKQMEVIKNMLIQDAKALSETAPQDKGHHRRPRSSSPRGASVALSASLLTPTEACIKMSRGMNISGPATVDLSASLNTKKTSLAISGNQPSVSLGRNPSSSAKFEITSTHNNLLTASSRSKPSTASQFTPSLTKGPIRRTRSGNALGGAALEPSALSKMEKARSSRSRSPKRGEKIKSAADKREKMRINRSRGPAHNSMEKVRKVKSFGPADDAVEPKLPPQYTRSKSMDTTTTEPLKPATDPLPRSPTGKVRSVRTLRRGREGKGRSLSPRRYQDQKKIIDHHASASVLDFPSVEQVDDEDAMESAGHKSCSSFGNNIISSLAHESSPECDLDEPPSAIVKSSLANRQQILNMVDMAQNLVQVEKKNDNIGALFNNAA